MHQENEDEGRARARRRGKVAVLAVTYGLLVALIAMAAADISWQLYGPRPAGPPVACKPGLRALVSALDRARDAAAASGDQDEDAALATFRGALGPEWTTEDTVARACKSDPRLAADLDVVQRLRYAEERAVRRDAAELAPLRLRVRGIVERGLD
jgi:hypothetical protein